MQKGEETQIVKLDKLFLCIVQHMSWFLHNFCRKLYFFLYMEKSDEEAKVTS